MAFWQGARGHETVLDAFRAALPSDEDELRKLGRNIEREFKRQNPEFEATYGQYRESAVTALGNEADRLLADFLVSPADHFDEKEDIAGRLVNRLARVLVGVHFEHFPTQSCADALIARLRNMLEKASSAVDISRSSYDYDYSECFYFPEAGHCLRILFKHRQLDGVDQFINAVFQGEFNCKTNSEEYRYEAEHYSLHELLGGESELFHEFAESLLDRGELSYEWFESAVTGMPYVANAYCAFPEDPELEARVGGPAYIEKHREYLTRLIRTQLALLPESAMFLDIIMSGVVFKDLEWLEHGLRYIETHKLKAKDLVNSYEDLGGIIRCLLNAVAPLDGNPDFEQLLSQFKERDLLVALPYAGYAREPILKALGWDGIIPLQRQLFALVGTTANYRDTIDHMEDVYNSSNPDSGVVDRAAMDATLRDAEEKQVLEYAKALRASSLELKNALTLILAVLDLDRDKVEKKLNNHAQIAIKAYGLYPVKDETDLRERYLKFKAMHKEATKYGPERQENTRAAVSAGLKNLAQTAGYTDDTRLEWAMEADIAISMVPFNESFDVESWQIKLVLDGITPRIEISKQGKQLKSVPAKVRKAEAYQRMRETQDMIRQQASRFRKALEDMMCNGERITREELSTLIRFPLVHVMLSQLILQTDEGSFGLLNADGSALVGLEGEHIEPGDGIRIAHVYYLFDAGVLAAWQKATVEQHFVQAFKQVFRELYVLTPAESRAGTRSRRFYGQVVDSAVASRLLQNRGWSQVGGDSVEIFKRFPLQQQIAEISFTDLRHFLSEYDTATVEEIWFEAQDRETPLDQLEPITFSEVMRDVDLFVSVAQAESENERWSNEMVQRRSELITTLASDIGLSQVSCEEQFVFVEGKLANYRIHLGTGIIHIQPGNYLCVIPSREKSESVYLPFADTDRRTAEIISKILMLVSDDSIEDEEITAQIMCGRE